MKKLLFSAMALSMVFFNACEKDETTPSQMLNDNSQKEKSISVNKSQYTALDSMAMAAGVEQINSSANGYDLTFYNNPTTYSVEIISFNDSVEIEYVITSSTGGSDDVTIDVTNENFYIESIGNISFNTFAQSPISESRNILENITAVTTVHHALNPEESRPFDNNGEGDEYDTGDHDSVSLKYTNRRRFWGRTKSPCRLGVTEGCESYYVLGIRVSHSCPDAGPC